MKEKKGKLITLITGLSVILLMILGISFAIFRFGDVSTNQELVLGDIWMDYAESNGIILDGALPGDDYTNYFEFTVTGTNTYTKKDIWYDISLSHGDIPIGRVEENRIEDSYLKFKLVEVNGESENVIFTDRTYYNLDNKQIHVETIGKGTRNYSKTYRLYMVISEKLTYGNSEGAILTSEEFGNIFGSIKVNVSGDFKEKELHLYFVDAFKDELLTKTNSYIVEDGSMYLSGNKDDNNATTTNDIDFNYVWYSGKLWRITAINKDGSMKLVTDDVITSIAYGEDTNFYIDEENKSWMYQWLNEDFLDTLYNYQNIIVEDALWNVTDSNASSVDDISKVLEKTKMVSAKVGLLNSYEYYKSYEKLGSYENGYLNVGYNVWLLNPYSINSMKIWSFDKYGKPDNSFNLSDYGYGVRPSINLKPTIEFSGGDGSKSNPYTLVGDKEKAVAHTTLLKTRISGEYVRFNKDLYRIIGVENDTTKLTKVNYIMSGDAALKKLLSSNNLYGNGNSDTYWDYYLNNTWKTALADSSENLLVSGTYYLGTTKDNYKLAICANASNQISTKECSKTTSTWSGYVGTLRYGEMFASQHGAGHSTSIEALLINPYDSSSYTMLNTFGRSHETNMTTTRGIMPTIHIKSDTKIIGGSGRENDPYTIAEELQNYSYSSSTKYYTYTVSLTGRYKVQLWGAQGGYGLYNGEKKYAPGKGGYAEGIITLNKGEKLYVYIGGQGGSVTGSSETGGTAGYNGGGKGGDDVNYRSDKAVNEAGGGGGGATDIRYFGSTTPTSSDLTWNSTLGLNSRIMVAAGGAGSAYSSKGGYAGGLTGGIGGLSASTPGSQTGGSSFGKGANGSNSYNAGPGGGGGGYYGGKAGTAKDSEPISDDDYSHGGSGGSSFISGHTGSVAITSSSSRTARKGTNGASCANGTTDNLCSVHYSGKVFTSTKIVAGNASMTSTSGGTETGHSGNGYAKIIYIGE